MSPVVDDAGNRSDGEVLAAIAAGDQTAVGLLYDRHARLVFSVARRMLHDAPAAEDVVQDVFISAWRQAGSYDAARGSVATWLVSFARNRAIDRLRQHRVRNPDGATVSMDDTFELEAGDDVAGSVLDHVVGDSVREAVRELPERQREVIELAWFGGYTQTELADRLQIPLGTVKTRTFNGMQRLRALLVGRGIGRTAGD